MMKWINDGPYTCPLLMRLQGLLLRQKWCYGVDGWVLLKGQHSRARCIWPRWIILTECWFWNTKIGVRFRSKCGGLQQREQRLKSEGDE